MSKFNKVNELRKASYYIVTEEGGAAGRWRPLGQRAGAPAAVVVSRLCADARREGHSPLVAPQPAQAASQGRRRRRALGAVYNWSNPLKKRKTAG